MPSDLTYLPLKALHDLTTQRSLVSSLALDALRCFSVEVRERVFFFNTSEQKVRCCLMFKEF